MIKLLIGTEGRLPKTEYSRFIDLLREVIDEMGEPGLYIMLAMLVITLWRGFPYHIWRQLHRRHACAVPHARLPAAITHRLPTGCSQSCRWAGSLRLARSPVLLRLPV